MGMQETSQTYPTARLLLAYDALYTGPLISVLDQPLPYTACRTPTPNTEADVIRQNDIFQCGKEYEWSDPEVCTMV